MPRPITFLSDYGLDDDFVGVCHAVIARILPEARIVDLTHGLDRHDVRTAGLVLRRALPFCAPGVHLAVVDPGVGAERRAIALRTSEEDRILVGPDNGLLSLAAQRFGGIAEVVDVARSPHRLEPVSATFHGRDLFAPVAARIACGEAPPGEARDLAWERRPDWPDDLAEIVYVDHFGNAMTGLRAANLGHGVRLSVAGRLLNRAFTFGDAAPGDAFWYENSNGLAEVAVNQGRADRALGLAIGSVVTIS
jgi:S-adenosyl-L-methionine hydrolase (adenosine-forming)